jgi:hypothetical protein
VLGQLLDGHGDTTGAHAAWQQAIDAGYEFADDLRERISPSPEPEDEDDEAGLAAVPPGFDLRNLARIGIEVLEHGLPALPETLSYQMALPVAYWKADQCAVVLILRFSRHGRGQPAPIGVPRPLFAHPRRLDRACPLSRHGLLARPHRKSRATAGTWTAGQ